VDFNNPYHIVNEIAFLFKLIFISTQNNNHNSLTIELCYTNNTRKDSNVPKCHNTVYMFSHKCRSKHYQAKILYSVMAVICLCPETTNDSKKMRMRIRLSCFLQKSHHIRSSALQLHAHELVYLQRLSYAKIQHDFLGTSRNGEGSHISV
jgi:hypothetical protein